MTSLHDTPDRKPREARGASRLVIATGQLNRSGTQALDQPGTLPSRQPLFLPGAPRVEPTGPWLPDRFAGRVGWAPVNGSFQSHVTALRTLEGNAQTREWLRAMDENGSVAYRSNSAIVQAVADGEVDFGLANHYYLLRFKDQDPDFPVEQTFFAPGDPGNLVNVAGVGHLAHSERSPQARQFIRYLLSDEGQQYFVDETFEYPAIGHVARPEGLSGREQLDAVQTDINLDALRDLEATLEMLREVGLL